MGDRPPTARERAQAWLARTLLSTLPPRAQVWLSGRPAVVVDGLTLDPQVQLLLRLRELTGAKPIAAGSPAAARRRLRREALVHRGPEVKVGAARDLVLPTPARPLAARHYAPERGGGAPLLVFFHGGGFALGDLDTHDALCRLLCRHARVHVLSVDYRLAPEAPFPAAVEDATAGWVWARENAAALGADPARVGVGGDSAGANLAAVVAQTARAGERSPAVQLLLYPATDASRARPSLSLFAKGFFLTAEDIRCFQEWYTGVVHADVRDPRVSPLCARDLSGLAPALVVTGGFDPLRDEGEAYAAALRAAGSPVAQRRLDGLIHGFATMTGVSPACRQAVIEIARELEALLRAVPEPLARAGGGRA